METNGKMANTPTKWKTVSPKLYEYGDDLFPSVYLRPVLIGEEDFGYRAYDYRGGFYICTQFAAADKKEYERQVEFDDIKEQYLYLMHYIPIGRANPNSWEIQQYEMYCLELTSLESLDTINFATIAQHPDWKLCYEVLMGGRSSMPDWLLLWNHLSEQVKELKQKKTEDTEETTPRWIRKMYDATEKEAPLDARLVNDLKANGRYDTIIKTDNSTLYVNTDYLSYEIADDPELFHVTAREYYPDGTLKSQRWFLAGIYTSESLPFGYVMYYDKNGQLINNEIQNQVFFHFQMDYYFKWMNARGYIDTKTGKGKPVMKINAHINPHARSHGETRVQIRTNWQIQTDDDEASSLGLVIKNDDDTETVFIFSKSSRIIWDKFTR